MRGRLFTVAVAALAFSSGPALAQITGLVRPAAITPPEGSVFTIRIDVDLADSGKTLGSFGVILRWDPAVLQYLSDTGGGEAPFTSVVVNRSAVGSGSLRFSAASPSGATGVVNIMNVTYRLLVEPCGMTRIDLEFSSLGSTGPGFEDLLPLLTVKDGEVLAEFVSDLRVIDPLASVLTWSPVSTALVYDAIRGSLANLFAEGDILHLGPVVCLENDSIDTTTGPGAGPASPDPEVPPPGEAFFYLVRHYDGLIHADYVFGGRCVKVSSTAGGDCP